MASNLYEVLGLERDATIEDIRKAYRKRALKTHPDRLPQGASEAERKNANEQFRLINNAYEVLNDENNRRLYDQHGVWPPPTATQPQAGPSYARNNHQFSAFGPNNPFETDPFFTGRPFAPPPPPTYTFTDPFDLFNTIFNMNGTHPTNNNNFFTDFLMNNASNRGDADFFHNFFMGSSFPRSSPFGASMPFGTSFGPRDPWGNSLMSQFGPFAGNSTMSSFSSSSQSIGGSGGGWVSQSTVTRSINGRTETVTTRRDAQGNEVVTYSSPEGERRTVNGVEQATNRALPASSSTSAPLPQATYAPTPAVPNVSRLNSRHTTGSREYNDPSRRSSSSSHRRAYDNVDRSSHDSHKSSRSRTHSHPNHDSHSSSSSRSTRKSRAEDEGHQVDSGSNDQAHGRHEKHRRHGW